MTLIKSISGIRGTIGGKPSEGLTPVDAVKYTAAFGTWIKNRSQADKPKMVVGRDARISGEMLNHLVCGTLTSLGIDVIDLGLATTPTVEIAVISENASGGIILTASHNPKQWNALKLLNEKGEFISSDDGTEVLTLAEKEAFFFAEADQLGLIHRDDSYNLKHIEKILSLNLVNKEAIRLAGLCVAIDCVNSVGGLIIPSLLRELGVKEVFEIYTVPNGLFPHNPEPLPEHLTEISRLVKEKKADLGIVVDPDVDRLALICEDGSMFGEEYTLVAVADYILNNQCGNTVSNLSSSRALNDVTLMHGGKYSAAAVGEVNVVEKMKETNAVIGGEGNGGIIYPPLHYGRDALAGIALFLSHLALSKTSCSELRKKYPAYFMSKNKIELSSENDIEKIFASLQKKYASEKITTIDGVKIDFTDGWVHLRKSNTEPIVRIYSEARSPEKATDFASMILNDIRSLKT